MLAMKRTVTACVIAAFFVLLVPGVSAQSLGEAARAARKKKPAATASHVYTNDDLPTAVTISVVGAPPAPESEPESAAPAAAEPSAPPAPEDRKKLEAEWRARFDEQRKVLAQAERELSVLQREQRLQAAVFYSDAGTRLRDEKRFAEEQRRYQTDIQNKQREVDAARQKLDELREQLRRAGLPSSLADERR